MAFTPLTAEVSMRHSLARATSLGATVRSIARCALPGSTIVWAAALQCNRCCRWALHSPQSRSQRRRSSDEPLLLGRRLATRRDPDRRAATPRRFRADHAIRRRRCGSALQARSWASRSTSSAPATSVIDSWERGALARTGNSPCRRPPAPAALGVRLGHPFPLTPVRLYPFPLAYAGA